MSAQDRLVRAADHLRAVELPDGRWAHRDDATQSWWVTTAEELGALCDYLDHEREDIARDAYSHWCAGSSAEEQDADWEPPQ